MVRKRQALGEMFKYVVTSNYESSTITLEVDIVGQPLVSRVIHMANEEEYTVMNLMSLLLRQDVGDDGSVALERAAECFQEHIHDTVLLPVIREEESSIITGREDKVVSRELVNCTAGHDSINNRVVLSLKVLDEELTNRNIGFEESSELHYGSILELFMEDNILYAMQDALNYAYSEMIDYVVKNANNLTQEEAMMEVSNIDWERKKR